MNLSIDGDIIDSKIVTYNSGLGYGNFHKGKANIELHNYILVIGRNEITDSLSGIYDEALNDIRRDDEFTGDVSEFKEMGYCSLSDAFSYPGLLEVVISTYFDRDIFEVFVPKKEIFIYVINSTDRVSVTQDGITIEGRCFKYIKQPNI